MKKLIYLCTAAIALFVMPLSSTGTVYAQSYYVNPNQVYSYSDMIADIKELKRAYPDLIQYKSIGKSEYGRNIYAVSLGTGPSKVFINGSHHAREWMTTTVNMNMIDKYAFAYKKQQKLGGYDVQKLLKNTTIWFIPMVNPDGVTLQQGGLKYFPKSVHSAIIKMNNGSKNFKRWKANAKGVDLNRQYNAKWYGIEGPNSPSYKNYRGKAPHTAREVQAVLSFVNSIDPEVSISYHSSGQIIFWNYEQSGSRYTRDYAYAKTLGKMTGYDLVYPKSFKSGGGFSDWFSRTTLKPAFTIEIAPYAGETHVPVSRFPGVWQKNSTIGLYVSQEGFKLFDKRNIAASKSLEAAVQSFLKSADDLESYYYSRVKSESDLRITEAHEQLYAKVQAGIKKNETAIGKLPVSYRTKPLAALKPAKTYRDRSLSFMNTVKTGDKLLSDISKLEIPLNQGLLNNSTIALYNSLANSIQAAETKINSAYGVTVRNIARSKYVSPSKDMQKNIGYEIQRYQMLTGMQKKIHDGRYDETEADLQKLYNINEQSKKLKSSDPSRYKTYTKLESTLMQMQADIETALENKPEPEQTDPNTQTGSETVTQTEPADAAE
ncbi:M14 family zinc carboxypeptidase [Peribacillus sp. SCS-155]|uniref:M14 family zinc carboxypeptidase n=1 Tax=Peribacillus sedimenti TaxID=3115297 RepID=UPI003905EFBB